MLYTSIVEKHVFSLMSEEKSFLFKNLKLFYYMTIKSKIVSL